MVLTIKAKPTVGTGTNTALKTPLLIILAGVFVKLVDLLMTEEGLKSTCRKIENAGKENGSWRGWFYEYLQRHRQNRSYIGKNNRGGEIND